MVHRKNRKKIMANNGTSGGIHIGGESFVVGGGNTVLSPTISVGTGNAPTPNGDRPSEAMNKYVNKFRDFAFQKICPPDYGPDDKSTNNDSSGVSIARITGIPANEPDYISDHHFIGIMRAIDDMLTHSYKGQIIGSYGGTNSS